MKILLVGVVTREMAQSAVSAGYDVISLDYFGDSDQPASARVYSLIRDFFLEPDLKNLASVAKTFAGKVEMVVVGAGLENEPALFEIDKPEFYWTNSLISVSKARDPKILAEVLSGTGMQFPKTIMPGKPLPTEGNWLIKDRRCSGGLGVKEWDGKASVQQYEVLQEKIDGELMSACFLADGKRSILIGLTHQYAGIPELGASPFAWCGNVAPYRDPSLEKTISSSVQRLTEKIGMIGVNGIDFILSKGVPFLLEINPRWTGSLELFERLYGINLFQLHMQACNGNLPEKFPILMSQKIMGKGILYARHDTNVGDTSRWKDKGIADIPHKGEMIPADSPICTIFSSGKDRSSCWDGVIKKAQLLMEQIST